MNDVQEFFNGGGAIQSEEERKSIIEFCKDCNPYWCIGCKAFSILDRGKRFHCELCGSELECADRSKIDEFRLDIRRKLIVEIPKKICR